MTKFRAAPATAPNAEAMQFRSAAGMGVQVDEAAGILREVKVMSVGEARGHGVRVDAVTLAQVLALGLAFGDEGCPLKFNQTTFDHGHAPFVGVLKDFRMNATGDVLLADAHLFQTKRDEREYLIELAQKMPSNFGLSIDFWMTEEVREGLKYARCVGLDFVTVVDIPAANYGLFRVGTEKDLTGLAKKTTPPNHKDFSAEPMTPEQLQDVIASIVEAVTKALAPMEDDTADSAMTDAMPAEARAIFNALPAAERKATLAQLRGLAARVKAPAASPAAATGLSRKDVEEIVSAGFDKFKGAMSGRQPGAAVVPAGEATKTGFAATVTKLKEAGMKHAKAIAEAARLDSDGYNKWIAAGSPALA